MGTENQYQAKEHFKCSCGNKIEVIFEVWEYPQGVHNYDNIEIDNAELLDSFYFTIDFYDGDEDNFSTCHICDGNNEGMGNFVRFDLNIDLDNEFVDKIPESEYSSVSCGSCDWCNSLHIECPNCGAINLMDENYANENVECEGGCGLIFKMDTTDDRENLGEFNLTLVDIRIKECAGCGEKFLDEQLIEICNSCEEKYNEE